MLRAPRRAPDKQLSTPDRLAVTSDSVGAIREDQVAARAALDGVGLASADVDGVVAWPREHAVTTRATAKHVVSSPPLERRDAASRAEHIASARPDDATSACWADLRYTPLGCSRALDGG